MATEKTTPAALVAAENTPAPAIAPATATAQPAAVDVTPAAGGSYTRDPATGALTLVTPSTTQE
jgi:hypothetical protein